MIRWNLQQFAGEKTERATPKRRQEARRRGQIARSPDLVTSSALLVGLATLSTVAVTTGRTLMNLMQDSMTFGKPASLTATDVRSLWTSAAWQVGSIVAPVVIAIMVTGIVANVLQGGASLNLRALAPDFSRINPAHGIGRLFSARSLVELLKSLLKVAVVGAVAYSSVSSVQNAVTGLGEAPLSSAVGYVLQAAYGAALRVAGMMIVLALLDYLYQRYSFERGLRMSKEEVKEEFKSTEGNPTIKRHLRERQRKMAMARMMQQVPKADVIITNPTHYSVALKYDGQKMRSPQVVAKGIDELALRIREVGRAHDVAIVENRLLARSLYSTVEIGEFVPETLYQAVAEVLAYVYRLRRRA